MNIQGKYQRDIWYVLQKIKDCSLRRLKSDAAIQYRIDTKHVHMLQSGEPVPADEARIIKQLIEKKVIKEVEPEMEVKATVGKHSLNPFYFFYLEVQNPAFENLYQEYENKFRDSAGPIDKQAKLQVFISKRDGIYLDAKKKKLRYALARDSKRSKLLWSLNEKGITGGPELAKEYYTGDMATLLNEINEINNNFKKYLQLETTSPNLIVHFGGGGYGLNKDDYDLLFDTTL